MRRIKHFALFLEFLLVMIVPYSLYVLLLIMSPSIFLALFQGEMGALIIVFAIVFGGIGIWGSLQLFKLVFDIENVHAKASVIKPTLLMGIPAYAVILQDIAPIYLMAIIAFPTAVLLHFTYLSRSYLWGTS